jgi:hypothetical protein
MIGTICAAERHHNTISIICSPETVPLPELIEAPLAPPSKATFILPKLPIVGISEVFTLPPLRLYFFSTLILTSVKMDWEIITAGYITVTAIGFLMVMTGGGLLRGLSKTN